MDNGGTYQKLDSDRVVCMYITDKYDGVILPSEDVMMMACFSVSHIVLYIHSLTVWRYKFGESPMNNDSLKSTKEGSELNTGRSGAERSRTPTAADT